jgi:hypothetical protein
LLDADSRLFDAHAKAPFARLNYHIALQCAGASKTVVFCQKLDIGRTVGRVLFVPAFNP